jgi:hypothetical protein
MSDVETQAQQIKTRRLEIACILAESKRAFVVDKAGMTFEERVTLEAEDARLALAARTVGALAEEAKRERRKQENRSMLNALLEVLRERGEHDLIKEAQKRLNASQ